MSEEGITIKAEYLRVDYPVPLNKLKSEGWKVVKWINGVIILMRITYQ